MSGFIKTKILTTTTLFFKAYTYSFKYLKKYFYICLLICYLISNGCAGVAIPIMTAAGIVAIGASIVTIVNLARDQYPDIDFDKPAPTKTTYSCNRDTVWNAVVDTLMEMKEQTQVMDRNSGIIRTAKKNLNDVSWIGKGLGKTTFLYEFNITIRQNAGKTSVSVNVPFWEEKMFVASKEKNIPEGSNMMRHIFFRNLNKNIKPSSSIAPTSPTQDMRYAPLTKEPQQQNDTKDEPIKTKPKKEDKTISPM